MPPKPAPRAGQVVSFTRLITDEDILAFGGLSGDQGVHHVERDASGRLLAQGLLTASLPTQIGGSMDYIAHLMRFEFVGAVYGGDTLTASGVVDSVVERPKHWKVAFIFDVKNQDGKVVLKGTTTGHINRPAAAVKTV